MEYDDLLTDTIKEMYEITDKKCEIDLHDYDSNLITDIHYQTFKGFYEIFSHYIIYHNYNELCKYFKKHNRKYIKFRRPYINAITFRTRNNPSIKCVLTLSSSKIIKNIDRIIQQTVTFSLKDEYEDCPICFEKCNSTELMMCPNCQNVVCETCIITQKLSSCCFCRTENSSDLKQLVMDLMLKKEYALKNYNEINIYLKRNKQYKKIKLI